MELKFHPEEKVETFLSIASFCLSLPETYEAMTFLRCLCLLFILCCCNSPKKEAEAIRVSVLRGPSAIAFAEWMENAPEIDGKPVVVRRVDSPDLMQAEMIKGEADIAVLPMISAANLYNKGVQYHLAGCPIWGTLYLAGKPIKEASEGDKPVLHIFGAGTTPDILTRYYLDRHKLDYSRNYTFTTAREVMQGLLAGKVDNAVLGEPFLSMALRKDSTLQILADLNRPDSAFSGFAQTAVLYAPALKEKQAEIDSLLRSSCRFATGHPEQAIRILETEGVFAPGMLTPESVERCKIDYKPASEAKENIVRFLQLIEEYEPKALGGKLPDEGFYK